MKPLHILKKKIAVLTEVCGYISGFEQFEGERLEVTRIMDYVGSIWPESMCISTYICTYDNIYANRGI